jgi:serine/threonine protein kinase
MTDGTNPETTLLTSTGEAIVPLINGCARVVGKKDFLRFKKAIDYFGPPIAACWRELLRTSSPEAFRGELVRLGGLSEGEARREATATLARFATASPPDQEAAIDYLAAIPASVARFVPRYQHLGSGLPWPLDREPAFLGFLPIHVPPFSAGILLEKTPYRLESVLGSGETGVVYRVANTSEPSQKRVVKFCLDNALVGSLAHEREHLNRLLTFGLARWSSGIARLFGYNLDTQIPYLVYGHCPGVDLSTEVRRVRQETGAGFKADLALALVTQVAGALAFSHSRGMVYGDLKPANVIIQKSEIRNSKSDGKAGEGVSDFQAKLTDFATSLLTSGLAAGTCPTSSRESAPLVSAATHVRLLHGANSSMYMCEELRRGDQPHPHHDIYSLGVLWFQVLVGDVTREMHPGWAEELVSEFRTPKKHVEVLQRCVGYHKKRPANAVELLPILQSLAQVEGLRPAVTFVSERLRKLDERFAKARGLPTPPDSLPEGASEPGRESPMPSPEDVPTEVEALPKTDESAETLWGQETRILGPGFIPQRGASSDQINRDAELGRLKQLLASQLANQAFEGARETLEVLIQLHPYDPEVQHAQALLAQRK